MDYVTIFMAWPYANGPLHLGHVAGNCLPADIQYKYERARGNRVLMCSGSDEHGTPITVTADEEGIHPQDVVDRFHNINHKALIDLGCSWNVNIDPRGIEYGGTLYNRTTDLRHKKIVNGIFKKLFDNGFLIEQTMQQYCSVDNEGITKFLPDRYVEGKCPSCNEDGARGDQCDSCGATFESNELIDPYSKIDPNSPIEIKDTNHLFFKLDLFQESLEKYLINNEKNWKPNVRSMTRNWLKMGLRPRAVTRDIEWGVELPLTDNKWVNKRIYVWFEAVQGYLSCPQIWAERFASKNNHILGKNAWHDWILFEEDVNKKHIYFMGKDNIPFHTIIWPAIIMGLNASRNDDIITHSPKKGDLIIGSNIASNEYLMLQGGQFSKSRKHGIWLPEFLRTYDPDALRYYLSINMPEGHDTDFRWEEFVDRVNNELIGNYGNFVNRVLTLTHRLECNDGKNPLLDFDDLSHFEIIIQEINDLLEKATQSLERQRFKESLRFIMNISQIGNVLLQKSEPWKYLVSDNPVERHKSLSGLALTWRILRGLAIITRPFMPFQSDKIWEMIGEKSDLDNSIWDHAFKFEEILSWNASKPYPLFKKLDLEEIMNQENVIANEFNEKDKKTTTTAIDEESDYMDFEDFLKVEMRTGTILNVEDHPNADKLWVVTLQDTPNTTRTICAGLKGIYNKEKLEGLSVVYVANLKPRKLRGIMSEGMLLAADDGDGNVKLLIPEGNISTGSLIK